MANMKFSALNALAAASFASDDLLVVVDTSAAETKNVRADAALAGLLRAQLYVLTFAGSNRISGATDGSLLISAGGSYFAEFRLSSIIQVNSTVQFGWVADNVENSAVDTGRKRVAAGVQGPTNGSSGAGWDQNPNCSRTTAQFDKTDATLANVTGLTATLLAGRTYKFVASLPVTASAVGGYKVAIAGTCTATAVYYDVVSETNGVAPGLSRQTALGGAASGSLGTTVRVWVEGVITVNAAGTLTVQFAQSTANGTSSVLIGADLQIEDVP